LQGRADGTGPPMLPRRGWYNSPLLAPPGSSARTEPGTG